jgi:predicted nucleic acid-binding protein
MKILVDTSVLIDALRDRGERPQLLARLVAQGAVLCSCDITLAEIYAGMRDKERSRTEELLDALEYVACDPQAARAAGALSRDWRRRGATLTLADAFLAVLALRNGLILLTDNRRHFPMPELTLWSPEDLRGVP